MAVRNTEALNDEAAAWFARLQYSHVSTQDEDAFQAWVEADPARAVAYARVEATWERAERLTARGRAGDIGRSPPRTVLVSRRAAAAIVAAGIVGGGFGLWAVARGRIYVTRVGERRTITLADGSSVALNTNSRILVAYSENRRDLKLLTGEAHFEVRKDPARPFRVAAGDATVRAVGTAFNIRLRGPVAEVTVTEGVVDVSDKAVARTARAASMSVPRLEAGSAALVASGGAGVAKVALDPDALQTRTAWRQGLIELRGETLEQAVAEFNRYSESKLVIEDPRIAAIRVGGTFGTTESDKFVRALEDGFNIRAAPGGDGNTYLTSAS